MIFALLNTALFPCPRTHRLHVRKLAAGFVQRGYHFREIVRLEEVADLQKCDILYVSSHFHVDVSHRFFSGLLHKKLIRILNKTRCYLLLWHFHVSPRPQDFLAMGDRALHLGEDLYSDAVSREHVLDSFRKKFDVLTLKYGSPLHPEIPLNTEVERDLDFNFIGRSYKRELTQYCEVNYNSLVRLTPPSVSEPLRMNSFRRALINLTFHANENVVKGVVVERFAEALSMGGIICHDHPRIRAQFPSCPSLFYVETTDDIDSVYERIKHMHQDEVSELRICSYELWRSKGLAYFSQAGRIIRALKGL